MYRDRRHVNLLLFCFKRNSLFPLSIAILFLTFCPQLSQPIKINAGQYNQNNENPDRTVAELGPRDIQPTTILSSSASTPSSTFDFNELTHTLYVISLDGKITAINARQNGRRLWIADTGAILVDSSLSKIEISRDSRSVRLIPSLIGGLYEKYDEDGHVEPLPFDADALLDASFKLHEELVITGGKTIDTLGLDLYTGQVLYSFSNDDPKKKNTLDNNRTTTADNIDSKATLIVKRITQTVRARSARNGYEKWNFSVSNHELFHLHPQSTTTILRQVYNEKKREATFSGHFEYQLQSGVVLAFDETGHSIWSSSVNAPIAAVWEFKNGQLKEKSLFETKAPSNIPDIDSNKENRFSSSSESHRLAFLGEFNSTPYVIVSSSVQKQLIYEARKNNVAGLTNIKRPILSPWHKAYQKRTLSIGSEMLENNDQRSIGMSAFDHNYPLALRPNPTANHQLSLSTIFKKCDVAGYLELVKDSDDNLIRESDRTYFSTIHSYFYIQTNILIISSVFLGALVIIFIWYFFMRNQIEYLRQKSTMTESSSCTTVSPPLTPECYQTDQYLTPLFQSRYTLEYEHVRFLGRGGFGVVFEAINKLDQRRVAIKRVSLKKTSGKEHALKEIRHLAALNHPNLIQYYYAWDESPPVGWQQEEDKTLLVRNNVNTRDSLSTFATSAASGNDSESMIKVKPSQLSSVSPVYTIKPLTTSRPSLLDDHSSNPLRIDEDLSPNGIKTNENNKDESKMSLLSSDDNLLDANNNKESIKRIRSFATSTKSSRSSSPLFDHSSDSSLFSSELNEKNSIDKQIAESDDSIVFLHDKKYSSSPSPIQTQTKSSSEKKKLTTNEKDIPTAYFYFVMELCQPESLRDRLIQRTIDQHQAWSIFDQIVRGIEYIHSKNLIHRDLKPSNILFSMDDVVKIGDFGLVSAFGEDKQAKKMKGDDEKSDELGNETTLTIDAYGNNEIGGTVLYMSPEQINRKKYDHKVDIYAMGIILFELLYPFSTQMERMQVITNVRLPEPIFPTDFECGDDSRNQLVCHLIRWLLSYSARDRPRASELRQDTSYQSILRLEAPYLLLPDNHQQNQDVREQDQRSLSQ